MGYRLQVDGVELEAQIVARRPQLSVRIGTVLHAARTQDDPADEFTLSVDGVVYRGWRCTVGDEVHVRLNGRTYLVRFVRRDPQATGATAQEEIRASMPGIVVAVHCEPGQAVQSGDRLLTLESMKLQMTVVASHAATVRQVHVSAEAGFERGALLVSLARAEVEQI